MGIEDDNGSPAGDLSDSENERLEKLIGIAELMKDMSRQAEEKVNLLGVKMAEEMQKAIEEQKSDDELMLIKDEYVRKFTSSIINANNQLIELVEDIGIFTREEALKLVGLIEGEEGFEDYPKASWMVAQEQDEDYWLANWLPQNPLFFKHFLNGEWPEWLSPPPSNLGE